MASFTRKLTVEENDVGYSKKILDPPIEMTSKAICIESFVILTRYPKGGRIFDGTMSIISNKEIVLLKVECKMFDYKVNLFLCRTFVQHNKRRCPKLAILYLFCSFGVITYQSFLLVM